jgi:hypothetical protein
MMVRISKIIYTKGIDSLHQKGHIKTLTKKQFQKDEEEITKEKRRQIQRVGIRFLESFL